jgi:hypothetical protein
MTDRRQEYPNEEPWNQNVLIQREKRKSPRNPVHTTFSLSIQATQVGGMGSDMSQKGAYFVTSDDIPVELTIEREGEERTVTGKIVRMDPVSEGTQGIAIQFDTRVLDF